MRLTVDWLSPVLAANARLLQCVAPLGASSRVRRTARSTRSSPICRGAPGRISSPKPTIPSVIKRFRHIPTVQPVLPGLAAPAALLSPLAHSRTMRARKASERELRGCGSSCRKAVFCSGLTTSSRFLGRPRGFDMIHDNPFPYLYNLFMTQETSLAHWTQCLVNASALSEARFRESVKLGEVLCARSIEPFESGRWWLWRTRANGWRRSNGYGN